MVGGKTVLPGAPAITVSGYTLSLGTAANGANLVDDGTTMWTPQGTQREPARTTVPTITHARTAGENNSAPHSTGGTAQVQSSILNVTGSDSPPTTTLVYDGQTEVFSQATFSDLADLSTTKTVHTSVSNHNSGWITGVPIVVLPHGI